MSSACCRIVRSKSLLDCQCEIVSLRWKGPDGAFVATSKVLHHASVQTYNAGEEHFWILDVLGQMALCIC